MSQEPTPTESVPLDSSPSDTTEEMPIGRALSARTQSAISIVLVIHLFCIAICFASVLPTSDLGARLLSVFSLYLQPLHLDLDYTPYYLTRETLNDDTLPIYSEREYVIEYLPVGADESNEMSWIRMGENLSSLPPARQRLSRYSNTAGYFVDEESIVARFIRDVADYLVNNQSIDVHKVRLRQHYPIPRQRFYVDASRRPDPDNAEYYATRYTALVVTVEGGAVEVMKDVPRNEAALIRDESP